jgi:hypothetical protein
MRDLELSRGYSFRAVVTRLNDGILLQIETSGDPGYAPDGYSGAFAGMEAAGCIAGEKIRRFFADVIQKELAAKRTLGGK